MFGSVYPLKLWGVRMAEYMKYFTLKQPLIIFKISNKYNKLCIKMLGNVSPVIQCCRHFDKTYCFWIIFLQVQRSCSHRLECGSWLSSCCEDPKSFLRLPVMPSGAHIEEDLSFRTFRFCIIFYDRLWPGQSRLSASGVSIHRQSSIYIYMCVCACVGVITIATAQVLLFVLMWHTEAPC